MMAAPSEILHPIGMAGDPARIEETVRGDVAGVGRGGGEAAGDAADQARIVDRAGIAAVADAEIALVPLRREPELEADLLLDRADDPAEAGIGRRVRPEEEVEGRGR